MRCRQHDWQDNSNKQIPPYVDFWHAIRPAQSIRSWDDGKPFDPNASYSLGVTGDALTGWLRAFITPYGRSDPTDPPPDSDDIWTTYPPKFVPVPGFAVNGTFDPTQPSKIDLERLPAIEADSVVVGVIDSGIGLGNSRFRDGGGNTRILASWQQNGLRPRPDPDDNLPFGTELYRDEIDTLLDSHSVGGRTGYLREDEFNRAAGLVDFHHPDGHRELSGRTSHGTHVLDTAAGLDPARADPATLRRLKIMAVNLPNRATIGLSGEFLDFFALLAIKRIADLADAIWTKSALSVPEGMPEGFPVVINLSFGKNAGLKDGLDFFNLVFRAINAERRRCNRREIHLVIPVGNDNLEQGTALFDLADTMEIAWQTPPEDQSANFLEIWTEPLANPQQAGRDAIDPPIEIAVTPPGCPRAPFTSGRNAQHRRIGDYARLYSLVSIDVASSQYRFGYILCSAAPVRYSAPLVTGPMGAWSIQVRNVSGSPMRVYLNVQTDQSLLPRAATGLRPRFEREDYRRYLDNGRVRDTFAYPYDPAQGDLETSPVLRRHGTINATAVSNDIVAVAGYRLTDGKPAAYSSTGLSGSLDPDTGRANPTLATPCDDGAVHFGLLGAGAANGSAVALSGTSVASACAARRLALHLLTDAPADFDANAFLEGEAQAADVAPGKPPPPKIGTGRLPVALDRSVSRLG